MADRRTVAEGAFSAPVVAAAARAQGIDMPITDAVARLVAGETHVADAVQALLSRPLRPEGRSCPTRNCIPTPPPPDATSGRDRMCARPKHDPQRGSATAAHPRPPPPPSP